MQNVYLDMGGLVVSVDLALAATGPACGGGKPVMALTYRVQNDVDTGIRGNTWAFDTYTRSVRVWRTASGRFCSVSAYSGGSGSGPATTIRTRWRNGG